MFNASRISCQVLMVGASLNQMGGIATVEKLILKHIRKGGELDISIRHITSHDEGTLIHRLNIFSRSIISSIWIMMTKPVDVVHIHLSDGGSLVRKAVIVMLACIFKKPTIIHAHGAEFHKTYESLPALAKSVIRRVYSFSYYFLVLSESWAEYYCEQVAISREKVVVFPNPIEIPSAVFQESPEVRSDLVRLCFFGRVGERKGSFDLLRAFAALPEEVRGRLTLTLAGDGNIGEAQHLSEVLGIASQTYLPGWVNEAEREKILANSDIFILPSYNEGLPMAILEAMSWRLPIIATKVGGIPEVVSKDNGILIDPGNIRDLSEAICSLAQDESYRCELGKNAFEVALKYDVTAYCKKLVHLYKSVAYPSR